MNIKQDIADLKRLETALKDGTPEARRQWLQLMRREVAELLADINREIDLLANIAGLPRTLGAVGSDRSLGGRGKQS
jgi:hypothetical protein